MHIAQSLTNSINQSPWIRPGIVVILGLSMDSKTILGSLTNLAFSPQIHAAAYNTLTVGKNDKIWMKEWYDDWLNWKDKVAMEWMNEWSSYRWMMERTLNPLIFFPTITLIWSLSDLWVLNRPRRFHTISYPLPNSMSDLWHSRLSLPSHFAFTCHAFPVPIVWHFLPSKSFSFSMPFPHGSLLPLTSHALSVIFLSHAMRPQ